MSYPVPGTDEENINPELLEPEEDGDHAEPSPDEEDEKEVI